jgi:hypothetical protein
MNKNRKVAYVSSAVVIALSAGLMYWEFASDNLQVESQELGPFNQALATSESEPNNRDDNPIVISVKNITVEPIDSSQSQIHIAFDAYNPNRGTIILESIQYKILIGSVEVASGEIGERLEGFLASQGNVFPVISSGNVTLKDTDLIRRNRVNSDLWNQMNENTVDSYHVNGTYSFSQTTTLQASGGDRSFSLVYP